MANAVQAAGLVLLAVGVAFAFGWAVGLIAAGAGAVAFGVALERGK